jgi:ABC-type amino acid transport substrate-binding protein
MPRRLTIALLALLALIVSWWIHPSHFGINPPAGISVFDQSHTYRPWLERIRHEKVVPVGIVPWHFPFSFSQGKEAGKGFSVAFTQLLVVQLGHEMGIENLTAIERPMLLPDSPDKPFPALASRDVAFECNTSLQSAFHPSSIIHSSPFFVSGVHAFALRQHPITKPEDLRGKSVLVQEWAFQHEAERLLNEKFSLEVGTIPYPILQYAPVLLEERKAYAMVGDALRIFNLAYASSQMNRFGVGGQFGELAYVCTLLSSEVALRDILNRAITKVLASPAYQTNYQTWFLSPLEDIGYALQYPMPQGLQQLIKDSGGTIP